MATQVQNAKAILDALADSVGKTVTVEQATNIVEEFINQIDGSATNEEKAETFNTMLIQMIRSTGRAHKRIKAEQDAQATLDAAADSASSSAL